MAAADFYESMTLYACDVGQALLPQYAYVTPFEISESAVCLRHKALIVKLRKMAAAGRVV